MGGERTGDASGRSWRASALIAAAWTAALTGASVGLFFIEETYITTNRAFNAVLIAVTAAFVAAPFAAGSLHGSRRVRSLVAALGIIGLVASIRYGSWAYSTIGGGP